MTDKLFDLLKIVLEKYLISTVGAVTSAFIIYYITPSNNKLLVKFTETGYKVFLGCICFLIIEFARWLVQKIQHHNYLKGVKEQDKQRKAEECRRNLEELWEDVDQFSRSDYQLLLRFVKNGNEPYYSSDTYIRSFLLNSNWVHKSESRPTEKVLIKSNRDSSPKAFPIPVYETISGEYQYVLRKEIYQMLKYSYENYGKISHFK